MPLTAEEMEMILVDEMTGREPSVSGAEADAFRQDLQADLKLAEEKGWTIEVPSEFKV